MDTKDFYIKSQKKTLNWGIAVTFILLSLSLFSLIYRKNTSQNLSDLLINITAYTVIFGSLIYNRFKLKIRAAQVAFFTYLGLALYAMLMMALRFKKTQALFNEAQIANAKTMFLVGYGSSALIMFGMGYLYFRNYLATKKLCHAETTN